MYLRQKESKLLVFSKDEREFPRTPKNGGCCSLHWLPAGDLCEDYQPDDGPGILMNACSNCWYFNDRQLKYNKLDRIKNNLSKIIIKENEE